MLQVSFLQLYRIGNQKTIRPNIWRLPLNRLFYWIIFISLVVAGVIKLLLTKLGVERHNRIISGLSMVISVLAVLLLAMTRESYAVVVAFLLLVIKGCLLFEYAKIGG